MQNAGTEHDIERAVLEGELLGIHYSKIGIGDASEACGRVGAVYCDVRNVDTMDKSAPGSHAQAVFALAAAVFKNPCTPRKLTDELSILVEAVIDGAIELAGGGARFFGETVVMKLPLGFQAFLGLIFFNHGR